MKKLFEKIKTHIMNIKNSNQNDENKFDISFKDFIDYCKKHSLLITLTILILALAHGGNIFYNNIGIDTQMFIKDPTFEYNWLGIGRFGLLVTKDILGLDAFSPFYAGVLFFVFLIATNIVLYYTFYKISNKDFGLINLCIPIIAFTHPIFVEQFIFMLQYAEIACAFCLTALATLWIFTWIKNKKMIYALLGIICLIISFGSYQSFIGLYITFCIFGFVLMFESEEKTKNSFTIILKLLVTFAIALLGYQIIINILPSDRTYLENSFFWGNRPIKEIISFIVGNVKEVIKGSGNYYNLGYILGTVLFILVIIYKNIKENTSLNIKNRIWYILSAIAFIGTPFYITIAIGHAPFIRAQFALPFTVAFLSLFVSTYLWENKGLKYISFVLIFYIFTTQMYMTQTLYYTDKMRNTSDIQTAYEIINDIKSLGVQEPFRIAVIGHQSAKLNPVCIKGETVGMSLFELNYNVQPYYLNSTSGIVKLFNCLGYAYKTCTPAQITEARKLAQDMPVWPEEGSLKLCDEYIIVKISEDEFPIE